MPAMTEPPTLIVTPAQIAALQAAARAAYPEECCGLIVGDRDSGAVTVVDLVPAANVAERPREGFAVDPQVQFDVLRRSRAAARHVIGHYHSHPNGSAILSDRDLAMAFDPGAVWIVIPVTAAGPGAPAAYRSPAPQLVEPVPIRVAT
jgi:proteasome lid subunit RPN8/RPN11